jgi:sporulation protein YlmC with PRC-barrel domain
MDICIDAVVQCTDGSGGRVACIVLNPITGHVTDVVVHEPGILGGDVLVPIVRIEQSTPDTLRLRLSRNELVGMQSFLAHQYRDPSDDFLETEPWRVYPHGGIYWTPYLEMDAEQSAVTYETIPPDELAMRRDDHVDAMDGRVGRIEGFVVDQRSEGITHLLLREGHLWGTKDVTIPISCIKDIRNGVVHLKLNKQEVAALPTVKVRR